MGNRLLDVEMTEAFDEQAAGLGDAVAVRVRRRGRIVGYALPRVRRERGDDDTDLEAMVAREVGEDVVRATIEDELRSRMGIAPATDPTITVAVCSRNRPARLARCLTSILRAASDQPAIDVLVVDNAPDDDATMRLVEGLSGVRYAHEPLPGLDFARNRALVESSGDVLAYVDDDVVVDPDWIRGLRSAFTDHPDAGCVTGLVLPYELRTEAQIRFEQRGGFRRGFVRLRFDGPVDATDRLFPFGAGRFGAGCNMAFRRSVLVALGGFDDALDTGPPLPGGGDLDIFFRVLRAGYPLVYEPTAVVCHEHREEHHDLRRQYWSWGTGQSAFLGKCWREPGDRATIAALARWWLVYEAKLLAKGALRRGGMTVDLAAAELVGGVVGAAGGYARSERRIRDLRAGQR